MGPFLETAMARVPVTLEAGVRTFFCGPESFTPDLSPIVGEAPGTRGYFVAAGMNSVGVLSAGGLGRVVAQWIADGKPDVDVTGFDIDRFRSYQAEESYRATRTTEILGTVYAAHTPGKQLYSARGAKLSPVHDRLVANGGYLREVSGWEGADWFAGPGQTPEATPTWGRADWFERWEAEHNAIRERVGLMDMSFMSKFRVYGRDAGRVLDHVSAGAVDGEAERITYTQWLDEAGKLQADLTVTKLADDDFWVVASDTAHGHVLAWLSRHIGDADVEVTTSPSTSRSSTCRARALATCSPPSPMPTSRTTPSPSAPRVSSSSPRCGCFWCASPTSGSSATSCTSRPTTPSPSTTPWPRPARSR